MTPAKEAQDYWKAYVMPAWSDLRYLVKDDATGIDPNADTINLGKAIARMRDAIEEFEMFVDDIGG